MRALFFFTRLGVVAREETAEENLLLTSRGLPGGVAARRAVVRRLISVLVLRRAPLLLRWSELTMSG